MYDTTPLTPEQFLEVDRRADDFEAALRAGARPRIEDFLVHEPNNVRCFLLRQLLLLELEQQRKNGASPPLEEYLARFPQERSLIEELFAETLSEFTRTQVGAAPVFVPRLQPGAILSGYELLAEIGRGGMGLVYKARQQSLDRNVALKVLGSADADQGMRRRFLLEARIAARLRHPGIVAIFEVNDQGPWPFYSMDLVEGENLAQLVRREGPLEPKRAARYVRQVAVAVAFAHSQQVLHRDLKPANVLVDAADQPRVTDFGLAKQTDVSLGLTSTGAVLGTPSYMPPEQAGAGEVTPASDVYALGALLYHLLTGSAPFVGTSPAAILRQVLDEPAPSPRSKAPRVPVDLETICLKCLEKAPVNRYASATAFFEDLDRFLAGRPLAARRPGLRPWLRRPFPLLVVAASLLLTALGFGIWLMGSGADQPSLKDRNGSDAEKRALKPGVDVESARAKSMFPPGLYLGLEEAWPGKIYTVKLDEPRPKPSAVYVRRPIPGDAGGKLNLSCGGLAFDRLGNVYLCSGMDPHIYTIEAAKDGATPREYLLLSHAGNPSQVRTLHVSDKGDVLYYSLVDTPLDRPADGEIWSVRLHTKAEPRLVRKVLQKDVDHDWWGAFAVQDDALFVAALSRPGRIFRLDEDKATQVYLAQESIKAFAFLGPLLYFADGTDRLYLSRSFRPASVAVELGAPHSIEAFAFHPHK